MHARLSAFSELTPESSFLSCPSITTTTATTTTKTAGSYQNSVRYAVKCMRGDQQQGQVVAVVSPNMAAETPQSQAAAVAIASAKRMLLLEPALPWTLSAAAKTAAWDPLAGPVVGVRMYLEAYNAAQRQSYRLHALMFSASAVANASLLLRSGRAPPSMRGTALEAIEAFRAAEALMDKSYTRLLPELWVKASESVTALAHRAMTEIMSQGAPLSRGADQMAWACALFAGLPGADAVCSGCGKVVQGLRKCSRCRRTEYCRWAGRASEWRRRRFRGCGVWCVEVGWGSGQQHQGA